MRLFIAIEIPEEIKNEIAEVQRRLKGSGADASWTRPEGMHLTLKFLGEVPETKITEIMSALAKATANKAGFRIEVAGVGTFPDPKNARVVWTGLSGEVEKLSRLQAAVEESMVGPGFEREKRTFTPHLTLGRIKQISSRDSWLKALDGTKDLKLSGFSVTGVSLMKSELKHAGAVYTEMGRMELK